MIHAARLSSSPRLQRFLAYLRDAGSRGASGLELITKTGNLNPHTAAAEIRANGYTVECLYDRTSERGARVYRYYLREERQPAFL